LYCVWQKGTNVQGRKIKRTHRGMKGYGYFKLGDWWQKVQKKKKKVGTEEYISTAEKRGLPKIPQKKKKVDRGDPDERSWVILNVRGGAGGLRNSREGSARTVGWDGVELHKVGGNQGTKLEP